MGKNNFELLKIAQKHLGQGGAVFRRFCGLPNGAAWCNAFIDYVANEGGDSSLYFNGSKMTYCPTSMRWCQNNLAQIPIYLAMPMDIIYFDWEPNGVPNHIGFVRERKSDLEVYTIEGNTSGGIVAQKTRTEKYVCGCFRPHFKPTGIDANKKLSVDGYFGYNTIAVMQRWLGVTADGILGKGTVKALQKRVGVSQDGSWGTKTSKAIQRVIGTTQDGYFGPKSVKAFQSYLNKAVFGSSPSAATIVDKEMDACKVQAAWMKNYTYGWQSNPTIAKSKTKGTCVTYVACVLQRIGVLKSGQYIWHDGKGKVDGANSKMSVSYPGGTIKGNKAKLKKGDILIVGDKSSVQAGGNSHICIFAGQWDGNGNPYVWDNQSASRVKKGNNGLHTYGGGHKVISLIRLK